MITTTTFTSTEGTSSSTSTRDCESCNSSCDCWTIVYLYEGTVAGCDCNAPRSIFSKSLYANPEEPIEDDDIFPDPIDRETLKLWRELSRKRLLYRNNFIFKPYIKRKVLNSKSGWLARVGRKKKRGK